jgi:hypothetical protein
MVIQFLLYPYPLLYPTGITHDSHHHQQEAYPPRH